MKQILCYGDSNTWGYWETDTKRFPWDIRWTGRLQQYLGRDFRVIEEGLCSRTIAVKDKVQSDRSGLEYLNPCVMSHHPIALIIIMLGTNDVKRRYQLSPGEIGLEMEEFVLRTKEILFRMESPDTKLLLAVPPPMDCLALPDMEMDESSAEKVKELPGIYKKIAEKYGTSLIETGKYVSEYQADGIHFSAAGHKQFADAVWRKIKEILPSADNTI